MGTNYCANPHTPEPDTVLWGPDAMGAYIGIKRHTGHYLIGESERIAAESGRRTETGKIPVTADDMNTAYRNLLRAAMEDPSQFY